MYRVACKPTRFVSAPPSGLNSRLARGAVRDARMMLGSPACSCLLADGLTHREIAERVDCSQPFISWKQWFLSDGPAGLYARHEGRNVTVLTPKMEARILNSTRKRPTDGSTHWSTRRLARKLGARIT